MCSVVGVKVNSSEIPIAYRTLIVDANNLFYRNHEKLKHMTYVVKNKTIITGGIYGSLRSLWSLKKRYLSDEAVSKVYIVFDNAKSKDNLRRSIDPGYKMNRKRQPAAFYHALDYFRFILLNCDRKFVVVYGTGYEADDIAPALLRYIPYNSNTLMVSDDLDWSRLIEYEGRQIHHLRSGKVYNKSVFNNEFDFIPTENRIVLYKTIRGDSSDNIPVGVPNVRRDTLLQLVEDYDDIFDVLDDLDDIPYLSQTMKAKFRDNAARLKLNHQLVSFIPLDGVDIDNYIFYSRYNPRVLARTYESLGFNVESFDRRVYDYLQQEKGRNSEYTDDFFASGKIKRRE